MFGTETTSHAQVQNGRIKINQALCISLPILNNVHDSTAYKIANKKKHKKTLAELLI